MRIFTCDGQATDGGPSLADSRRPVGLPPSSVWSVRICSCVAEGDRECRRLDELQAESPLGGELLIRQYAGVDLTEV